MDPKAESNAALLPTVDGAFFLTRGTKSASSKSMHESPSSSFQSEDVGSDVLVEP